MQKKISQFLDTDNQADLCYKYTSWCLLVLMTTLEDTVCSMSDRTRSACSVYVAYLSNVAQFTAVVHEQHFVCSLSQQLYTSQHDTT